MAKKKQRLIPIYTTLGDLGAFLVYPFLFNQLGEWVGFITRKQEVYSVLGHYVGYLADGPRILRKRTYAFDKTRITPPLNPGRIPVPAHVPLAPMMSELTFSMIDILYEEPERLSTLDTDDLREDMD